MFLNKNLIRQGVISSKRLLSTTTNAQNASSIEFSKLSKQALGVASFGTVMLVAFGSGSKKIETKAAVVEEETTTSAEEFSPEQAVEIQQLIQNITDKITALENKTILDEATKKHKAFIFIKPHAVTAKVDELAKNKFKSSGIVVLSEGELDAKTIDENKLIDNHYNAIASKAVLLSPEELNFSDKNKKEFQEMFGESLEEALKQGKVYNAKQACEKLNIDGEELEKVWGKQCKKGTTLLKCGGGFYIGKLAEDMFVINGFYMSMRGTYTNEGAKLHYYEVEFDPRVLSWEEFRIGVLGATNPAEAKKDTLRRLVYEDWENLGLKGEPNTGDNGFHGSASPFEASSEFLNWLNRTEETDAFLKGVILALPKIKDNLTAWLKDEQVIFKGKKQSIFDILEDQDAADSLELLQQVVEEN